MEMKRKKENTSNQTEWKGQTMGKVLAVLLLIGVSASVTAKDVDFRGMLRNYTGVRISEDTWDVPVNEQTVDLTLKGWGDITQITVNPYAYVGAQGDPEIGVREAYIDIFLADMDLRIGKQAVVWGEAEGAFITDVVSPQNMRSFILADFREIRMGIPAVRADYYTGPFTLEAVWIPEFIPAQLPAGDSIWAVQPDFSWAPASVSPDLRISRETVSPKLENSEIFGKISYFGSALNAEIMAGYAWDDQPVITDVGFTAAEPPNNKIDELTRGYKRYTVVGGSISTTLSSVVVRSEAAAYLNKDFNVLTSTGPDTEEFNQLHALAGLDWSLGGMNMSAQYMFHYIHEFDEDILTADEFGHTATAMVQDTFLEESLTAKLFGYFGFGAFDRFDALLRPSLTYAIEDGVELQAGAELFLGDEDGNFGQYSDNNLVYAAVKWYF